MYTFTKEQKNLTERYFILKKLSITKSESIYLIPITETVYSPHRYQKNISNPAIDRKCQNILANP